MVGPCPHALGVATWPALAPVGGDLLANEHRRCVDPTVVASQRRKGVEKNMCHFLLFGGLRKIYKKRGLKKII
jgi:hypothetical protein